MPNLDGGSSDNCSSDDESLDMELDNRRAVADILQQESVKRLIRQAMLTKKFPPQTLCAEFDRSCDLAASLFDFPVFIWVPECLTADQKPRCPNSGCSCVPRLKEYRQRLCEDIDFRCRLLYVKYQCMGTRTPRSCFSTVCEAYLNSEVHTMVHFPFILTKKMGVSKALLELVHDGMLSSNGLTRTVENVHRRREQRYYKLYSLFSAQVNLNLQRNPNYLVPTPLTAVQYSGKHCKLSSRMLRGVWLQSTAVCSALCERLMAELQVVKALRIDHSVKFCKRLKLWKGGTGRRESMKDARMLLLMQNEIGQIVGRRLTRSENNDEMRALLLQVKRSFKLEDSTISVVSDKASAIRNVVHDVFGGVVATKQDPFHVMQRFSEKLKNKGKRKLFYKLLQGAMYSVNGQLRNPEEMSEKLREVVSGVSTSDLSCSQSEWDGCLKSNLKQIASGDLAIDDNIYVEGGVQVSIVSTSQLEGVHAALNRLLSRQVSVEVGLRILDIFILEHNLRSGAKFGRNPSLGHVDIVTVARASVICRGGLPETPLGEFVANLLSKPIMHPQYRSESTQDFAFSKWEALFDGARINTNLVEASLNRSRQHRNRIKELLLQQSTQRAKVSRMEFLQSLCLSEASYESDAGFSSEEFELLRQLRKEQNVTGRSWSTAPLVTTIMFNIVASTNRNQRLDIRRRSYVTMVQHVASLPAEATQAVSSGPCMTPNLFSFTNEVAVNDEATPHEQAFQLELFYALRATRQLTSIKKVFLQVYDFASALCEGIFPKSEKMLLARWEAMKRASNRDASMKIKFKLPHSFRDLLGTPINLPDTGDSIDKAPQQINARTQRESDVDSILTITSPTVTSNSDPRITRCPTAVDADEPLPDVTEADRPETQTISIISSPFESNTGSNVIRSIAPEGEAVVLQQSSEQPFFMSTNHLNYLRSRADSLPSSRGKWDYMLSIFRELYPHATLSKEALRSRLRQSNPKAKASVPVVTAPILSQASKKRKSSACQSCQQKKKRCGDRRVNPHCTRDITQQTGTLDNFLS